MDPTTPSVASLEIDSPTLKPFTNVSTTPARSSRPASSSGFSSAREHIDLQQSRYYQSRRIRKDPNRPPPEFKKEPGEKWLWIMPLIGLLLGLGITGLLIVTTVLGRGSYNYCPVLDEDFSSGELSTTVWTKEIEIGGFGNRQFEETSDSPENVFIKDGQLYLKPTLQDEKLITTDNVINLTETGRCTSDIWYNCVSATNNTNGSIVQPVKSARINTKIGASIKYGRVEVEAQIPKGDWLWPAIWMMPVTDTYGPWPSSGEIDIMEGRGNNYTYSAGGNNIVSSALHWGPDPANDAYRVTYNAKNSLHSQFGDSFHLYGLEWSEKYLFTYIDTKLLQVFYWDFKAPFWPQGNFPLSNENGTRFVDPWSRTGRTQTPFDHEFYLILSVAVGGRNGWFPDGKNDKPWVDASPTAKKDFWAARDRWFPTWEKNGQMIINSVKMWQQC